MVVSIFGYTFASLLQRNNPLNVISICHQNRFMDLKRFTLGLCNMIAVFGLTTVDASLLWQDKDAENKLAYNSLQASSTPEVGLMELSAMEDDLFRERLRNINTEVPLEFNQTIKRSILAYLHNKKRTERVIGLCQVYKPMFDNVLYEHNVPTLIACLPIIESELNVHAKSPVGAMGLWQFMESTGKMYSLDVNRHIDERKDPQQATVAAAEFLSELHERYDDWLLALAAYNCGPGRVNTAIRRAGNKKDFWQICKYLPRETRYYVPKFIAAAYVYNYYFLHGLSPTVPDLSMDFAYYVTTGEEPTDVYNFAKSNNVLPSSVRRLNPALLSDYIPSKTKLKMPYNKYDAEDKYAYLSESTKLREEIDTFSKITPIVPNFVENVEITHELVKIN